MRVSQAVNSIEKPQDKRLRDLKLIRRLQKEFSNFDCCDRKSYLKRETGTSNVTFLVNCDQ